MWAESPPASNIDPTLLPFGGRPVAGLPSRPNLLNPEAVFRELAIQAVTYRKALESGAPTASQWKWQPRYVGLPKQGWHANPTQVAIGLQRVWKRIRGKRSYDELTPKASPSEEAMPWKKRRRISIKSNPRALL